MEAHGLDQYSPDYHAYHVALTDQLLVTLVADWEGVLIDARIDLVREVSVETASEIVGHSLAAHDDESDTALTKCTCADLTGPFEGAIVAFAAARAGLKPPLDERLATELHLDGTTLTAS